MKKIPKELNNALCLLNKEGILSNIDVCSTIIKYFVNKLGPIEQNKLVSIVTKNINRLQDKTIIENLTKDVEIEKGKSSKETFQNFKFNPRTKNKLPNGFSSLLKLPNEELLITNSNTGLYRYSKDLELINHYIFDINAVSYTHLTLPTKRIV